MNAVGQVLATAGLILCFVAWTHILLIVIPANFGSAPWEFAAASQTVDVFPLEVTGISLLACGAFLLDWRRPLLSLSLWCWFNALFLLTAGFLTVLNLIVGWNSVTTPMKSSLLKTSTKVFGLR